jgi:hypothetical protein
MTAKQIYRLPYTEVDRLWQLSGLLAEVQGNLEEFQDPNGYIHMRIHEERCEDGERVWVLGSLWFGMTPVMVFQRAGRGGRDYKRRFITHEVTFRQMITYINNRLASDRSLPDLIDPNEDLPQLTSFYGEEL